MPINFTDWQTSITPEQVEILANFISECVGIFDQETQNILQDIATADDHYTTRERLQHLPARLQNISDEFNRLSNGTMTLWPSDILSNALLWLTDKEKWIEKVQEVARQHTGKEISKEQCVSIYLANFDTEEENSKGNRIRLTSMVLEEYQTIVNPFDARSNSTVIKDRYETKIMKLLANSGLLLLCRDNAPNGIKELLISIYKHNPKHGYPQMWNNLKQQFIASREQIQLLLKTAVVWSVLKDLYDYTLWSDVFGWSDIWWYIFIALLYIISQKSKKYETWACDDQEKIRDAIMELFNTAKKEHGNDKLWNNESREITNIEDNSEPWEIGDIWDNESWFWEQDDDDKEDYNIDFDAVKKYIDALFESWEEINWEEINEEYMQWLRTDIEHILDQVQNQKPVIAYHIANVCQSLQLLWKTQQEALDDIKKLFSKTITDQQYEAFQIFQQDCAAIFEYTWDNCDDFQQAIGEIIEDLNKWEIDIGHLSSYWLYEQMRPDANPTIIKNLFQKL